MKVSIRRSLLSAASLAILASFGAAEASAQTAAPAPAPAAAAQDEGVIQEVVVTAQRRTQRLQDVPISVQVVSGQTMLEKNETSLETLAQSTPSLTITKGGATNFLQIRGIGSGGSQGFDQSVGTFIDDIYHGRSRSSAATFLDLDRVEVLKGPQSTFFGNNAIAGALNIVTKKPGGAFDANARALYGQNGQFALEGAAGGPLNDQWGLRVAATYNGSDGFLKNLNTGEDVPRERNLAGRVTLSYAPTENLDATLKVEAGRTRQKGDLHLQVINCPPPAPFTAGAFCKSAIALNVPTDVGDYTNESAGQGVRLNTFESVGAVNWRKNGLTFTSVTGYTNYTYSQNLDLDATPATLITTQAPESYQQVSQEFRVASPTGDTFEWLAGAYYQRDHLGYHQDSAQAFRNAGIQANPAFAALAPYLPIGQAFHFKQDEDVYSVFGSLTWNASEAFKLSFGLRGSWVDKSYTRDLFYAQSTAAYGGFVRLPANLQPLGAQIFGPAAAVSTGDRNDQAWMPSVKAQYKITPRAMVYASYARGFKAGGFNGSDATGSAANIPFEPEYVDAYETGIKSEWFDRRLLVNFDLYRSDYSNLQVTVREGYQTGPGYAVVRNAATSRSQGAELEAQWVVNSNFRLGANVTYLDSHYVNFPNAAPSSLQQVLGVKFQDLSGADTAYSPKWSSSLSATYNNELPGGRRLTVEVAPFISSSYIILPGEAPATQGSYVRWDARVTIESAERHWAFDLIGKNLSDETVLAFATAYPTSLGSYLVSKNQTRNIAAQVRYKW